MKLRFPSNTALLDWSAVFLELPWYRFQGSRPEYPPLDMWQSALDEKFTLTLAILQSPSQHSTRPPNSICPRDDDSTSSIYVRKYAVIVDTRSFSTLQFNTCGRVMHHHDYDFMCSRLDFSKTSVLSLLLQLWYIDETLNSIANIGNLLSHHWHHSWPPSNIAPSTIELLSPNPIFTTSVILVMPVMSLLVLLLSLQGTDWLLLVIADPTISRTAENRMLALVAAIKLLRQLAELLGRTISSSGM